MGKEIKLEAGPPKEPKAGARGEKLEAGVVGAEIEVEDKA
jgi:hypothetical protein